MSAQRGFTLVELLVSTAIGVLLLTLATNAFVYLRRLVQRNTSLVHLHGEAAAAQRVLADALAAAHPGAQWRLEADPGADGAWGSGDETVALTFLAAVASRTARTFTLGKDWGHDLTWTRIAWQGKGTNGIPTLAFGRSDGYRSGSLTWTSAGVTRTTEIRGYPQPRRDRRRDLDDNDLRHLPGATAAALAAAGLRGDAADLAAQTAPITGPRTRVMGFAIGWRDGRGHWTGIDARRTPGRGIIEYDASGTEVPLLAQPWSNERSIVLDGVLLTGEQTTVAPDTIGSGERRPLLLTVSFTLVDIADGRNLAPDDERLPRQAFSFTIPCSPVLGPL